MKKRKKKSNSNINALDRLADTTQMISDHLAAEIGVGRKIFASRLRHSLQVAELSSLVAIALDVQPSGIWEMAAYHDIGHRILGHQFEQFLKSILEEYEINRALRHEVNSEYSFFLHGMKPKTPIIEAAQKHSGERKAYRLEPGKPVTEVRVSQEKLYINEEKVYDIASKDVRVLIIRMCDYLCHIRNDYRTLMDLGKIKKGRLYIPRNEDLVKSFVSNSDPTGIEPAIAINKTLFDRIIELRKKVEDWQNSDEILQLRALEQRLLKAFWEFNLEKGLKPEEVIDKANIITETQFFHELEANGIYKRKG